jgi:hypothetical protein
MQDIGRMARLALGVGAVAFVAGVALDSIVGPNAASIDVRVQAALVGLIGIVIAATAGIAGAAYGARIGAEAAREDAASASREAQADRGQADWHRFTAERPQYRRTPRRDRTVHLAPLFGVVREMLRNLTGASTRGVRIGRPCRV